MCYHFFLFFFKMKILLAKWLDQKTLAPLCASSFQDPGISESRYVHNRITVQGFPQEIGKGREGVNAVYLCFMGYLIMDEMMIDDDFNTWLIHWLNVWLLLCDVVSLLISPNNPNIIFNENVTFSGDIGGADPGVNQRWKPLSLTCLSYSVILWPNYSFYHVYFFLNQKMNGLSIRELCCLFCCPPCPSRIAAKLAFLPPEPTYALLPDPDPGSGAGTASGSSSGAAVPSLGAPGLRSRLSTGSGSDRGSGGGSGGAGGGGGGGGGGGSSSTAGEGRWKLHLTERAEFQYSQRELDVTDVFLTRSSRGNRVGCMYIRCAPNARWGTHHPLNTLRLNMSAHTDHSLESVFCFCFK